MTGPLVRRHLFGLDLVDATSIEEVAAAVEAGAADPGAPDGALAIVVTPNVDHLVHLARDDDAAATRTARRAAWVLPDGQPVVWASRLLGRPLRARLAGSDLVGVLFPRLVATGRPVVVVATYDEVAQRIRGESDTAHAIVAPMLDLTDRASFDAFVDQCAEMVRDVRPSHLFVTLGFPKQCNVIDGLVERLEPDQLPVMLAVGASFDMHYGLVRRAPEWMRRTGLEWLFRFVQEPRRLFRRYFVDDPAFVLLVYREWRAGGAGRSGDL
jgi:N-acetylglucosaminyldiphosphoundecaprenol N-acetyl-beta-D-mannosaminyltransferase